MRKEETINTTALREQLNSTTLGTLTNTYGSDFVETIDEESKKRKMQYDALGRLIAVTEDPSGLNYTTTYEYDVLDNLTKVVQGSQERTYAYDSPEPPVMCFKSRSSRRKRFMRRNAAAFDRVDAVHVR